ncbi:unnamed protein product [Rodentolepis nana]|uniref:TPR_REGION domain-containing protein n=2 Tax=Rodentolepis nana TaxID=102285 RepID=A0A0R3THH1_RODNA|nr:unnamed protein product [Rodentolepis nana]
MGEYGLSSWLTGFEELAARNYESVRVNFALAILHTDFGEYEEAAEYYRAVLELFEKAINLSPNSLQARHNYCVAVIEDTGDLERGEECLKSASSLADSNNPNDEFVFRHLAMIRAKRQARDPLT